LPTLQEIQDLELDIDNSQPRTQEQSERQETSEQDNPAPPFNQARTGIGESSPA
jgi:hypothetical protein